VKASVLLVCVSLAACQQATARLGADAEFVNASRPTQCAEEDNIYVQILGNRIERFRIRAEHPAYIDTIRQDSTAPDFSHCDMSSDPSFVFEPRTVVLHDDGRIKLVGHTFASFWRPTVTKFRVGEQVEIGLHLVQLIRHGSRGEIEQLVVYPSDGYWRVKPMPHGTLPDTAYGSSFLFGPIEVAGRPFVAIQDIVFDPERAQFRIRFGDQRVGTLTVVETSETASTLALTLDPPLPDGAPFAALRSMHVSNVQADVAVAAWKDTRGENAMPVLGFHRFRAESARFGRQEPSLHNLSAPDLVFGGFERATVRPARAGLRP
jgi:hypothetical protein